MKFEQKKEPINGDVFVHLTMENGAALQYIGSFRPDTCEYIFIRDYIQIRSGNTIIAFDPRLDTWEVEA